MKKVLLFGYGQMGTAICHYLKTLGHTVVAVDTREPDNVPEGGDILVPDTYVVCSVDNAIDLATAVEHIKDVDVVVSSLPYFLNERIASVVFDMGLPYLDLGGSVPVSKKIHELAQEKNGYCFTDLGLAPGWVNILAEKVYENVAASTQVERVELRCGGLPQEPANPPLNYECTWSLEGLVNEYADDCEVIEDGEKLTVPGMSGLEAMVLDDNIKMEAFCTSGGLSHTIESMLVKGVETCNYKTIRYPGHAEVVSLLLKHLPNENVADLLKDECEQMQTLSDCVLLVATAHGSGTVSQKHFGVEPDDNFSAMQRATAGPISVVTHLLLNDDLVFLTGGDTCTIAEYEDVPYDKFAALLSILLGKDLS